MSHQTISPPPKYDRVHPQDSYGQTDSCNLADQLVDKCLDRQGLCCAPKRSPVASHRSGGHGGHIRGLANEHHRLFSERMQGVFADLQCRIFEEFEHVHKSIVSENSRLREDVATYQDFFKGYSSNPWSQTWPPMSFEKAVNSTSREKAKQAEDEASGPARSARISEPADCPPGDDQVPNAEHKESRESPPKPGLEQLPDDERPQASEEEICQRWCQVCTQMLAFKMVPWIKNKSARFQLRDIWQHEEQGNVATTPSTKMNNNLPIRPPRSRASSLARQDRPGDRCTINPNSKRTLVWDITTALLIIWNLFVIPLEISGLGKSPADNVLSISSALFWTTDMFISFNRGIIVDDQVVFSHKVLAINYLRTRFILDFVLLVIDWSKAAPIVLGLPDGSMPINPSFLRLLRVPQVIRLMKFGEVLNAIEGQINSVKILLYIGVAKVLASLIMFGHILACAWYGLGTNKGWIDKDDTMRDASKMYKYLTSLHWSFTQFHGAMEVNPKNDMERFFAIIVLLWAFIIHSCFVANFTNMIIQIASYTEERTTKTRTLRSFLKDHTVTMKLGRQLKRHLDRSLIRKQKQENEAALLSMFGDDLMQELSTELRLPVLTTHPMFQEYQFGFPRAMVRMCHQAVSEVFLLEDDVLFYTGDVAHHMYFTMDGEMRYFITHAILDHGGVERQARSFRKTNVRNSVQNRGMLGLSTFLRTSGANAAPPDVADTVEVTSVLPSTWISEAALWMRWVHMGDFQAFMDTRILMLNAARFEELILDQPGAHPVARQRALDFENACRNGGGADILDQDSFDVPLISDQNAKNLLSLWTGF